MHITSSNIGMESARSYSSLTARKTSALVMVGTRGLLSNKRDNGDSAKEEETGDTLAKYLQTTQDNRQDTLRQKLNQMSSYSSVKQIAHLKNSRDSLSTVRERSMEYFMKVFFGESKSWDYEEFFLSVVEDRGSVGAAVTETIHYHQETYFSEREDTSFSTKGTVCTADGREISFNVNVEMSRSFSAYYEENYEQIQVRMCDPLVINLEGDIAELTDQTFFFDIDADGERDEISRLGKGSGYLALDKNGDGIINDGSELFGARSGDGFGDLAAYDSDRNGWIDENDAIWEKLLIWTKDENGKDKCYKLSEKGVGAICLTNTSTDFMLNSENNTPNGRIRKTGIYLYENGAAGTIQHLDVVKHDNYV